MSLQNFVERTTFRVIRPPCLSTGVTPVETSFQTEENLAEHPEINQQHCKKKKNKKKQKNLIRISILGSSFFYQILWVI